MIKIILKEGKGRAQRRREREEQEYQSFLDMTSGDFEPGRIFQARFQTGLNNNIYHFRILSPVEKKDFITISADPRTYQDYSFSAIKEPNPESQWYEYDLKHPTKVNFTPFKNPETNKLEWVANLGYAWIYFDKFI